MKVHWFVKVISWFLLFCFPVYCFSENMDQCHISSTNNPFRCQRYNSCKHCKDYVQNCFCDTMCHHYDDCCPDVIKNFSGVYMPPRETIDCMSLLMRKNFVQASVISRCPKTTESEKSRKCVSVSGPLVYGGKSRLIYMNTHCAICHGEETYEFVPFTLKCREGYTPDNIKTELFKIFKTRDLDALCEAKYGAEITNKTIDYHQCIETPISSCPNSSDPQEAISCETGAMDAVYVFNGLSSTFPMYRNEYCARCNGVTSFTCIPVIRVRIFPPRRGFESLVDIASLECFVKEDMLNDILECGSVNDDTLHLTKNLNNGTYRNASENHNKERVTPNGMLTVVLVGTSLVSLFIQLAFYCYFKALRNFPGLLVICLATSLVAALLLFLISIFIESNIVYGTCVAVAAMQHWAFLCSFSWTNVMAFDVTRMLGLSTNQQENKRKKFLLYSLYAWSCPTVLTVSAYLADKCQWTVRPFYGSPKCWINNTFGLITYFLGPLFLALLVNICLYVASIVAIVRSVRQTRMVNPVIKDRLILSIRLIIIMGLPWIFSVVTAFTESDVADYIFIVLNALQGLFILTTFVLNKTFVRMCKAEIQKLKRPKTKKTAQMP